MNFTFFLLNPFPRLQYAELDFGDFEWDQCCHFERFQYAKHPICCIARPPSRHHHWSSLLLSIPIIIGVAIYENGANQTKWSHLTYSVIWSFQKIWRQNDRFGEVSHQHWSLIFLLGGGDSGSSLSWGQSVNHNFGSCKLDKYYSTKGGFSNKIGSRTSLEQSVVINSYRFLQPPSATVAFEHHIVFPS